VPFDLDTYPLFSDAKSAFYIAKDHALYEVTHGSSARTKLAEASADAEIAAFDEATIYLREGHAISRVSRGVPGSKRLVATLPPSSNTELPNDSAAYTLDATSLWALRDRDLVRVPLDGSPPTVRALFAPEVALGPIVSDATSLYFAVRPTSNRLDSHILVRVMK
jgi:hypothetical protein